MQSDVLAEALSIATTLPAVHALQANSVKEFADEMAAGRTPSIREIRARLHVGQLRAQEIRAYLAATVRQPAT